MENKIFNVKNGILQTIGMFLLLAVTVIIPLVFFKLEISVYAISCVTTFLSCSFLKRRYTTIICLISYFCFVWLVYWSLYIEWGTKLWNQNQLKLFATNIAGLTIEFVIVYFLAISMVGAGQKLLSEKEKLYCEKQLIQKKIESQSDFLAYMSHEIRTPINAVLSMNEMILQETEEQNTEDYAVKIRGSALHLLNFVTNVLDYSKIEAGKLEIIKNEFELTALLKELIDIYFVQATSKGLAFEWDIAADIPKDMIGDEIRISQVYANILSNAVKYTDKGTIKFKVYFEKNDDFKGNLICTIADTGTGIRTEDMERLFGSYSRLNLEKTHEIQGSGLGLKICKQTLELMNGTIDVQSEYGKGSVFTLVIPLEYTGMKSIGDFTKESERLEIKGRNEAKGNGLGTIHDAKVLIVDDNEINLQVAEAILKKTGAKVLCLDSGEACLNKIYEEHFDLLLLDHMMPEIDGLTVLNEMKSRTDHLCLDTKIVVLTANAVSGAKNQYLELGFDDYISKPISIKELDRIIAQLLPDFYKKVVCEENVKEVERTENNETADWLKYHIDVKQGLEFMDGDLEQYLAMLRIFTQDYEKRVEKLGIAMQEECLEDYAILVHGLKGNARTLGAMRLGELAFEEEKAAKQGDMAFLQEHQFELAKEWELVVEGFVKLLSETGKNREMTKTISELGPQEFEDQILTTMACLEGEQFVQAQTILQELMQCNIPQDKKELISKSLEFSIQENATEAMEWLDKVWRGE